ncbi:collagen alpha-1(VII) chain-like isoform X1 [Pungitius pungitius]|uniref:collagen alpha-1(VII) chain-like isoform X1 n=1 Tax=Pungitius pungitius TaxID=134920 RepID=UPI002E14469C
MEHPRFTFNPKEGIDNPALVISDDPEHQSPRPTLCHLKRLEGQNFGFLLRAHHGGQRCEVGGVAAWSPAQRGGLQDGDRVLEVNEDKAHSGDFWRIVRKIQACGLHLILLVLRRDEYEQAESLGLDLQTLARSSKGDGWSRPRLCHVSRDPECGLGMTVAPVDGQKGHFTVNTLPGGPAEKAGVRPADRLIWINGAPASSLSRSTLNKTKTAMRLPAGGEGRGLGDGAGHRPRGRVLPCQEEDACPAGAGRMPRPPARRQDHAAGQRARRVRLPAEAGEAGRLPEESSCAEGGGGREPRPGGADGGRRPAAGRQRDPRRVPGARRRRQRDPTERGRSGPHRHVHAGEGLLQRVGDSSPVVPPGRFTVGREAADRDPGGHPSERRDHGDRRTGTDCDPDQPGTLSPERKPSRRQ